MNVKLNFYMMKPKILSFLVLLGMVLIGTSANAADETSVSVGSTITYNVTVTTGTANNYLWTVSAGGSIQSGQGTSEITVLWSTAGAQTVTVQMTDANGCLSEPLTRNVTVNNSSWDLAAETNTTTCALITNPSTGTSGNNQAGKVVPGTDLPDLTSFNVTIANATPGANEVKYTVSDDETTPHTKQYTVSEYTSGTTITINHNADADLINMFTNTGTSNKTVTIYVDSVTDVNGSTVNYGGTKRSYTITVYPKPVITF